LLVSFLAAPSGLILGLLAVIITFLISRWFFKQLGGHTGDTYGAVVEWTEALFLSCCSLIHWT